jgi:ATP-dependent DNA ligase
MGLRGVRARRRLQRYLAVCNVAGEAARPGRQARKVSLEGIVLKRPIAPYRSGPSRDWLKVKNPDSPAMIRARDAEW